MSLRSPLLRREVRLRLGRRSPAAAGLAWAAGCLALGLATLAGGRLLAGEVGAPRATVRTALLVRSALVPFIAPALTLPALASEGRSGLSVLFLSRWRTPILLLAKTILPALAALPLVLLSGLPLWLRAWQVGGLPAVALARSELVLLAVVLAALALGLFASVLCRDPSAAAGIALLATVLAVAAPLLCGPLVGGMADAGGVIQASLVASPVVAVASALGFDILRTEPLYRLSPLGQRRFTYPSAASSTGWWLATALLAFGASSWRFAAARRGGGR